MEYVAPLLPHTHTDIHLLNSVIDTCIYDVWTEERGWGHPYWWTDNADLTHRSMNEYTQKICLPKTKPHPVVRMVRCWSPAILVPATVYNIMCIRIFIYITYMRRWSVQSDCLDWRARSLACQSPILLSWVTSGDCQIEDCLHPPLHKIVISLHNFVYQCVCRNRTNYGSIINLI